MNDGYLVTIRRDGLLWWWAVNDTKHPQYRLWEGFAITQKGARRKARRLARTVQARRDAQRNAIAERYVP